jgi:tRNA(Arg) A34 adenosine deaminase TadA
MSAPGVEVRLPDWVDGAVDRARAYETDEDRMGLVTSLARENVERGTGGPFGAAVFESASGRVLAVGLNLVVPLRNSVLHAEIVAIMMAQREVGSYTLRAPGLPPYELVTSCEPCAMCLGAVLWSGVGRLVCGAGREDAERIRFEEGPVFPESYAYLAERGIEVVRGVARDEAAAVLDLYARHNGLIYNG